MLPDTRHSSQHPRIMRRLGTPAYRVTAQRMDPDLYRDLTVDGDHASLSISLKLLRLHITPLDELPAMLADLQWTTHALCYAGAAA
jgi:hypothetical protein